MGNGGTRTLSGQRILVTRTKEQAGSLVRMIEELGGEAVHCPVIRTVPVTGGPLTGALHRVEGYDWLLFTSVNGVKFFFEACSKERVDHRRLANLRIGAVGPKTAEELQSHGLTADIIPPVYRGDVMADALLEAMKPGERVLLPRARAGRSALPDALRNFGVVLDEISIYDTVVSDEWSEEALTLLTAGKIHAVTFTSSSTVTGLLQILRQCGWDQPVEALLGIPIFTIGPLTSDTVREAGLQVAAEAKEATTEALVEAIVVYRSRN